MLYKTHKAAGVLTCLVAYDILSRRGMLAPNIEPLVQLAVIYPACSWASTAPDLDHALTNVKEQTPINILINKLLHIGRCSHRSVQTHSVLFTGSFCLLLYGMVYLMGYMGLDDNSRGLLQLMVMGVSLGVLSHLVMDSLSTDGIWLVPKVKFRLVPKRRAFGTGGKWESFVCVLLYIAIVYMVVHLVFSLMGYSLMFGGIRLL